MPPFMRMVESHVFGHGCATDSEAMNTVSCCRTRIRFCAFEVRPHQRRGAGAGQSRKDLREGGKIRSRRTSEASRMVIKIADLFVRRRTRWAAMRRLGQEGGGNDGTHAGRAVA